MLYFSNSPKINAHEHIRAGFDFTIYEQVMDTFNIRKVFLMATGSQKGNVGYEPHQDHLGKIKKDHPEKVEMFITVSHFSDNCMKQFESGLKHEPIGLKLLNGHPSFGIEPLDSPRLMPLYEKCAKRDMIVLTHWQLNLNQTYWISLKNTLSAFPDVTFVMAHLGVAQNRFSGLAGLLNKFENLYIDCSWGGYFRRFIREVDWEPERFRNFYEAFSHRILWGTDQVMSKGHTSQFLIWQHATELAILERETYKGWQKYFPKRHVFGMNLNETALSNILFKTPMEVLKRTGR